MSSMDRVLSFNGTRKDERHEENDPCFICGNIILRCYVMLTIPFLVVNVYSCIGKTELNSIEKY